MTGAAVPRWKIARLFAQVNLRVAVFVVAHTVSSRHQRLAFAVRHGLDRTTTDTLAAQVGGNRIGPTLRQAQIVLVRDRHGVVSGTSVSGRVALGGGRDLKKKKK